MRDDDDETAAAAGVFVVMCHHHGRLRQTDVNCEVSCLLCLRGIWN